MTKVNAHPITYQDVVLLLRAIAQDARPPEPSGAKVQEVVQEWWGNIVGRGV